jgi:integrase
MTAAIELAVAGFLDHKRALGRKYHTEEKALRLLVRFVAQHGLTTLDQLTRARLDDFLASRGRARPRSFNHLLGVLRCFLDWAVGQQLLQTSPLRTRRRRVTSQRIPFIFDACQARQLLGATGELSDNPRARQRGPTYRTIFALCYGLGLRAGEACGLKLGDIDFDRGLLVVVGGKFGKSRLVPFGPRVAELLRDQVARRVGAAALEPTAPLFSFDGRRCIHPGTASQTFHRLVATLALPAADGIAPPRLHDLRHSFAVSRLLRWYREGADPSTRLHQLSTFLGHVDPASTAVYLTITPELLEQANCRFEAFARSAWEEVGR